MLHHYEICKSSKCCSSSLSQPPVVINPRNIKLTGRIHPKRHPKQRKGGRDREEGPGNRRTEGWRTQTEKRNYRTEERKRQKSLKGPQCPKGSSLRAAKQVTTG